MLTSETEDFKIPASGLRDEQGNWWTSSEEAVYEQDSILAQEDSEYAEALISFTAAREALTNARVAREFYPVVVPVSSFVKVKKGKGKGKGKSKGKSKGKGRGNTKSKSSSGRTSKGAKGKTKGKGQGRSSGSKGANSDEPRTEQPDAKRRIITCYRCGKPGHLSKDCPQPASAKRPRDDDTVHFAIFDDAEFEDAQFDRELGDDWDWDEDETEYGYLVDDAEAMATSGDATLRGCVILDTGCTSSVSSINSADQLQQDRLAEEG